MECDFKSYTLIGQIAIVIVLEFIFKLFQNIFRKRINEISIDTDQHMLTINYYSVMEGNIQRKLLFENIVVQIKEIKDYNFKIYNKNKSNEAPISISVYKDGFNKTTFNDLINFLMVITKAISN